MPTPLPLHLKRIVPRRMIHLGSVSQVGAHWMGLGLLSLGLLVGSVEIAIAQAAPSLPTPDPQPTADADAAVGEFPEVKLGMQGGVVTELQIILNRLDYYDGEATGKFDKVTQQAVADFQTAQELEPTGRLDLATYDALEEQNRKAESKAKRKAQQQSTRRRKLILVGVVGVGGVIGLLGGVYFLFRFINHSAQSKEEDWLEEDDDTTAEHATAEAEIEAAIEAELDQWVEPVTPLLPESLPPRQPLHLAPITALEPVEPPKFAAIAPPQDPPPVSAPDPALSTPLTQDVWTETEPAETTETPENNGHALAPASPVIPTAEALAPPPDAPPPQALTVRPPPEPLPKTDVIEELIRELRAPDPTVRRQAIWELAQKADSRAVQPLVNLLLDSDSQQQSLVLEALSQIGVRTLKPINRALALSLQDENAQVRKNAIRDVSRIYALLSQLSQLIYYATDDPDKDVQETAQWALEQLKKIRVPHPGE